MKHFALTLHLGITGPDISIVPRAEFVHSPAVVLPGALAAGDSAPEAWRLMFSWLCVAGGVVFSMG